jgi:hypothetical protein
MLVLFTILFSTFICSPLYYFTDDVALKTSISKGALTIQIQKPKGGHLAWGLGSSMDMADFFLIQIQGTNLYLMTCFSNSHETPFCQNRGPWTLVNFALDATTRGWTATVTRDLSVSRGIPFYQTINKVLYSYGTEEIMPEGHSHPSNRYGVVPWDFYFNVVAQGASRVVWGLLSLFILALTKLI